MNTSRRRISAILTLVCVLGSQVSCNDGKGSGSIEGRLGSATDERSRHKNFHRRVRLDQITVELVSVVDPSDPDTWNVVQSTQPNADGSFSFNSVPTGDYTLRLNQPEFAGTAYFVDSTDFTLGDGQTLKLVLPLTTNIYNGCVPSAGHFLDPSTGLIFGVGTYGLSVLNIERQTVDYLKSDYLFNSVWVFGSGQAAVLAHLPTQEQLVVMMSDRIVRLDLDLLNPNDDSSDVVEWDDPVSRAAVGNSRVRYRIIPESMRKPIATGEVYVSADEGTLYVTVVGTEGGGPAPVTAIVDASNLEVLRFIDPVTAYNPTTDMLFSSSVAGCAMINASLVRDEAAVPCGDFVPVPGSSDTWVITSAQNTDGAAIAFITVVDADGNAAESIRAQEFLGLDEDPVYGPAGFDETGVYFMMGPAAFRQLADGTWEWIQAQVPPGPGFLARVACNTITSVDPTNRYRIDHTCVQDNNPDAPPAAVALYAMDQASIPVALNVEGDFVAMDRQHGRAIFAQYCGYTVVHYADPSAVGREDHLDVNVYPNPTWGTCSDLEACTGPDELCIAPSPTALSGYCVPNPRRPQTLFCGGMTQEPCDDNYDCVLREDTNPFSLGDCVENAPCFDPATCGPICDSTHSCSTGTTCQSGRCVPLPCATDSQCGSGKVCGMSPLHGRVCVPKGPLGALEICEDSADCESGNCIPLLGREGASMPNEEGFSNELIMPYVSFCMPLCYQHADCPSGWECDFPGTPTFQTESWEQFMYPSEPVCYPPEIALCEGNCLQDVSYCGVAPSGPNSGPMCLYYQDGQECTGDASCMGELFCLQIDPVNPSQQCSMPCADGGDCEDGRVCSNAAGAAGACGEGWCHDQDFNNLCGPLEVCIGRDHAECVDFKACHPASGLNCTTGACVNGLCGTDVCNTKADCGTGEVCHLLGLSSGGYCVPDNVDLYCDCGRTDAACYNSLSGNNICILPRECAKSPCDGSGDPACNEASPQPSNGSCDCAACTWDATDCGGQQLDVCPGGYDCVGGTAAVGVFCNCGTNDCP